MRIALIQGSSQKDKNELLFNLINKSVSDKDHEVINFGVFPDEEVQYSYVEIAIMISILLESKAVDFVITGCSSGQGMMLACNSLPGILCGYIQNSSDAYLFGRINDGNVASLSLGLNFGWAAEINIQGIIDKLFDEQFGIGYPREEASRKQEDSRLLKSINATTKRDIIEVISMLDEKLIKKVMERDNVYKYIKQYGENKNLIEVLESYCKY